MLGSVGRNAETQPTFWTGWGERNQDTSAMTGLKVVAMQLGLQASWKEIRSFDHHSLWAGPGSSAFSLSRVKEGKELPVKLPRNVKVFSFL